MNIILSGGGIGEKSKIAYLEFAKQLNNGKVLLIPFANENKNYESDLTWFTNEIKDYNVSKIEMVVSPEQITDEFLQRFEGIYFEGGNTFLLLHLLKSCQAFDAIKKFIQSNKVVMGGSAGALIFGKSIETILKDDLDIIASDENIIGIKDFDGFNILNGYSLFVHYRVKERQYEATEEKVQRLLKKNFKLICVPEEDSIIIRNNTVSLIGCMPAEVISSNSRFQIFDGEILNVSN